MSNVISIKDGLNKIDKKRLAYILDILDKNAKDPLYVAYHINMLPHYNRLVTQEEPRNYFYRFISGVISSVAEEVQSLDPQNAFKNTDLSGILELAVLNIESKNPFSMSFPFIDRVVSLTLIPVGEIVVIADVFINHRSTIQRAFEATIRNFNLDENNLF